MQAYLAIVQRLSNRKAGHTMIYEIKRGNTVIAAIKADGYQERSSMAIDRVVMNFTLPVAVKFKVGDTVAVYGQTYKINRLPDDHEVNTKLGVRYDLEFEALYYDLGKWKLRGLGATNQLTESEVYLRGDASVILDLVVRNANRIGSGWTIGEVEPTDLDQFTYTSTSLLAVLQDLATRYSTEFWVVGKTINLSKRQISSGLTLEFGKGKGLYTLSREKKDHTPFNRLYVFGGTQNIPFDYGFARLQLPIASRPYLQKTLEPGEDIVEEEIYFENIYPTRKGALTGLGTDELVFFDSTIDFDINDHLSQGNATIAFVSGQLAGFEFTISNYDHATKRFTINKITDDKAYGEVPNSVLKASVGDEYVLLNLDLPQSYITAAENKVLTEGQKYFNDNLEQKFNYRANLTPIWVKEQSPTVDLGYTVVLKNVGREINKTVRISSYTRDLQEDYKYPQFVLSDTIEVTNYTRELARQTKVDQFIKSNTDASKEVENLQTVARRGASSDRILSVKGLRASELLTVPHEPSDLPFAIYAQETGDSAPDIEPLKLPIASENVLGVIRIGNGLAIDPVTGILTALAQPVDLTGYATEYWVNQQGFLKPDALIGYATQNWVSAGFIKNQTALQAGANLHVQTGRFADLLTAPAVDSSEPHAIYAYNTGESASDIPPWTLPIASATVLGGIKIGNGLSIDPATGVVTALAQPVDLSNYFTKAESDYRYAFKDGVNATGTWNINVPSWTGQYYNPVSATSINLVMGYSGGSWRPVEAAALRGFLGIPIGGDTLQSVMDRGATTTHNFYFATRDRAIVFGNVDTQIYSRNDGSLAVYAGGLDRITIKANGNVGFGGYGNPQYAIDAGYSGAIVGNSFGLKYPSDGLSYHYIYLDSNLMTMVYKSEATYGLTETVHQFKGSGDMQLLSIYNNGVISAAGAIYAYGGTSKVLSQEGQAYYQVNTWLQLNGAYGLYCPTVNNAHLLPNPSSYGTWTLRGNGFGYGGFYDEHSRINFGMYDANGNGGDYDGGYRWIYYYNRAANSVTFNGSLVGEYVIASKRLYIPNEPNTDPYSIYAID